MVTQAFVFVRVYESLRSFVEESTMNRKHLFYFLDQSSDRMSLKQVLLLVSPNFKAGRLLTEAAKHARLKTYLYRTHQKGKN